MHRWSVFAAFAFSLAVSGIGTTALAQVPQCVDTSAIVQEDSLLRTTVECTDGGHLGDVTLDHVATVAGSGAGGWAGDGGAATAAALNLPNGVFVDRAGNLYVADSGNHLVRRVDAATGIITTIAGVGGSGVLR